MSIKFIKLHFYNSKKPVLVNPHHIIAISDDDEDITQVKLLDKVITVEESIEEIQQMLTSI